MKPQIQNLRSAYLAAARGRDAVWPFFLTLSCLLLFRGSAYGLAEEQVGPDTPSRPTVEQPGWPKGIAEPLRHSSRVYSRWVNGNEIFYFQATTNEINELIALFSKARLRDHELQIEEDTNSVKSFAGEVIDCNVSLQIMSGIALAVNREKDTTETFEPRMTLFIGEDFALLKQLKLPENIHVHSEVPGASLPGHPGVPRRKTFYGRVQFEDGKPAVDFEQSLQTTITLWETNMPDGIPMGSLTSDAIVRASFSDTELADLKSDKSWLTVTVGNYMTSPKSTDPKFPSELFAADVEQAKPFRVRRPSNFYYGRLLFEDGSPAVLTNAPWPNAEISVNFPYTGPAKPDSEGYFKVFFTPEQFAQLRTSKQSRNIYVPVDEHSGRATDSFPPDLLSTNKANAGVVQIAKPVLTPKYEPARAPSLIGKPLPALDDFRLEPPAGDFTGQRVLVCFFDPQQRPSRFSLTKLVEQAEGLKRQGISVVAVRASIGDRSELRSFAATNHITFPVGSIGSDEEKTRFNWGIKSLPWLILTDKEHVVRAEGFVLEELEEKLR